MTYDSWHVPNHLYFMTATICGWHPLFNNPNYSRIILDSLTWLRKEKRMNLFAFVLMPSHLHAIIYPMNRPIGSLLQNFSSFTAHAIIDQLESDHKNDLLTFFHDHRRNSQEKHSIWQDVQAKNIFSEKFLKQKLEYIHQNPVSKEWNLAKDRSEYEYSSACYYDKDRAPIIDIDDLREFLAA